jgi:hypothetical protein
MLTDPFAEIIFQIRYITGTRIKKEVAKVKPKIVIQLISLQKATLPPPR